MNLPGLLLSVAVALAPQTRSQSPEASAAARDRILEQAAAAVQAGRRAEAKALLVSAAERFSSVRALIQLARLQSGDGDATGALATLTRAGARPQR